MEGNGPGGPEKALEESGCWPPCPPPPRETAWMDGCVLGPSSGLPLSQPTWNFLLAGLWDCLSACSCCLLLLLHPPKLCIRGQEEWERRVPPSPARLSHAPSTLPAGATPGCHPNVLLSPGTASSPVSTGFGESEGLVEWRAAVRLGWEADGEEACRVGDSWGDEDVSGQEATLKSPCFSCRRLWCYRSEPPLLVLRESNPCLGQPDPRVA